MINREQEMAYQHENINLKQIKSFLNQYLVQTCMIITIQVTNDSLIPEPERVITVGLMM